MYCNNKPISQYKLKKIIECFCLDLSATQTSKLINLNRNTVNRYFNIFRKTIYQHQTNQLKKFVGEVEIDESYFGPRRVKGKSGNFGRGTTYKQPVFGIYERNGRVYTEIIPNCKARTLHAIITGKISLKSTIYSDCWQGYTSLVDVGYNKHFRISHKDNQFSEENKNAHINGIEAFWSFIKRRLTKFNGVKKNFNLHLKESEWRWNKQPEVLKYELSKMLRCC